MRMFGAFVRVLLVSAGLIASQISLAYAVEEGQLLKKGEGCASATMGSSPQSRAANSLWGGTIAWPRRIGASRGLQLDIDTLGRPLRFEPLWRPPPPATSWSPISTTPVAAASAMPSCWPTARTRLRNPFRRESFRRHDLAHQRRDRDHRMLTIDARPLGSNVTVNANGLSRIYNITATAGDYTLAGLNLTGGSSILSGGGAVRATTVGVLTFSECVVTGNSTSGDFAGGGGVWADFGHVRLVQSVVSGNSTTGENADGGGIFAQYGGVTLTESTVNGNSTAGRTIQRRWYLDRVRQRFTCAIRC